MTDLRLPKDIKLDPYKDFPEELKGRITADPPQSVINRFKAVCPERGILQAMVNHFIKSVSDEMEQKGIKYYTDEHHDEFLNIIQRRTAPLPSDEGLISNDAGGVAGVRAGATLSPSAQPESSKQDGAGRKKSGTKTKRATS